MARPNTDFTVKDLIRRGVPSDQASIAIRLRKIRIEMGLTQSDFAKSLGVSQSYIKAVESGANKIPLGFLIKANKKFGITPNFLILGRK